MPRIWKMTEKEYFKHLEDEGVILTGDKILSTIIQRNRKFYRERYINAVKEARKNKEDIPYEVLAQFPYLVRPDLSDEEIDEMVDSTFQLEFYDKVLTWMYWVPKKERKHSDKITTNWL